MTEDASGSADGVRRDESPKHGDPTSRVSGVESPGRDGSTHRTAYDASADGSLGAAVVVAIAEAIGTPTDDIEPLYETIDPDALAALFGPRTAGGPRRRGTVSFVHDGCHVTVDGDEIVVDTERSDR
jgi:hypothetical protein